ncbi:MAG: TIM barrel protein [Armatimonadetes bacterium]|nr:TIM barrel protein [Armatimonadota bacterium]MBS1711308.1 TIM barrel protein [Armatimonadota bacterium]MBX3107767.1 TIM barrel protein [Fimbriimonadaceae bacterium]
MNPSRRDVLKASAGLAAGLAAGTGFAGSAMPQSTKFKLKYAPHFGMFENHAGKDPVDQLKFAADQGFTAWEDNGMMGNDPAMQEKLGNAMKSLGMTFGVFVADAEWSNPVYALGGEETRANLRKKAQAAVECAKRVGAKWMTVVPGPYDKRLAWDYQTANVIDCLKTMAEVFEPHGLVMVIESLNPYRDHPGMFLSRIPQAFQICKAVGSPSCKILFDMYHQQITEGNIIPNIDLAWSEIAYFQLGDNPGRNEPLTGEMNYRNIFKHIHGKSTELVIGMEHGKSVGGKEGEVKLLDAYRWCDDF